MIALETEILNGEMNDMCVYESFPNEVRLIIYLKPRGFGIYSG